MDSFESDNFTLRWAAPAIIGVILFAVAHAAAGNGHPIWATITFLGGLWMALKVVRAWW